MSHHLSTLPSVLASATVELWTLFLRSWRTPIVGQVKTYRPEEHYMRGPGPKWREKHVRGATWPHSRGVANFSK
jgi:hypothetical protein